MINEKVFLGLPSSFKDLTIIYPPKIKDVMNEGNFNQFIYILTMEQDEIADKMAEDEENFTKDTIIPTPFQMLLANCHHNEQVMKLTEQAFNFFTKEKVRIMPEQGLILFIDEKKLEEAVRNKTLKIEDLRVLKEEDFFDFQNEIRSAVGRKKIENTSDDDPRVARIKALSRKKIRIKEAIKAKKGDGISLSTLMASLCCMNMGINPLNIEEISYASVGLLTRVYQEKEKFDRDMMFLANGADSKKLKPKYWIRNIDD